MENKIDVCGDEAVYMPELTECNECEVFEERLARLEYILENGTSCTSYAEDWNPETNSLELREGGVTGQTLPLLFRFLNIENLSSFLRVNTQSGTVSMSDDIREAFRIALGLGPTPEIPEGYTRQVRITSTSREAYIDTGLQMNGAYRITATGRAGTTGVLFNAYESDSARMGGVAYNTSTPGYERWWMGVEPLRMDTTGVDLSQTFDLIQAQYGITIMQGDVILSDTYEGTDATGTANILLGRSQKTDITPTMTAWEAFRVELGGDVLLDYVPCTRDSDGVAGMWDKVSQTFKQSNGSVQFTVG